MHPFQNFMKPQILSLTSFLGREAAQTASQVEDFGLPAILEKMNFLFTPLNSGPFWDISRKFQKFLIISQSSLQHENQWKLTLVDHCDICASFYDADY